MVYPLCLQKQHQKIRLHIPRASQLGREASPSVGRHADEETRHMAQCSVSVSVSVFCHRERTPEKNKPSELRPPNFGCFKLLNCIHLLVPLFLGILNEHSFWPQFRFMEVSVSSSGYPPNLPSPSFRARLDPKGWWTWINRDILWQIQWGTSNHPCTEVALIHPRIFDGYLMWYKV